MSHIKRRGQVAQLPDLDVINGDAPIPPTPTQNNPPPRMRSFSRGRGVPVTEAPPAELAAQPVAAEKPAPAKPKQKEYTDVNDLPNKLEKEISQLHSSIAQALITEVGTLQESAEKLTEMNTLVSNYLKTSTGSKDVESEVYKKLIMINSDHKVSATTIANKRRVIEKLQLIIEVAAIPEKWTRVLGQSTFPAQNVGSLQSILEEATKALLPENTPPILVGLVAAKNREADINTALMQFSNNFTRFFINIFKSPQELEQLASQSKGATNRPRIDTSQPAQPFSVNLENHTLLRAIYSYSWIILWIKNRYPDNFKTMVTAFHDASKLTTQSSLIDVLEKSIKRITEMEPTKNKNDLFSAGSNMKEAQAQEIWDILNKTSDTIFDSSLKEKIILMEFWGVEQYLDDLIPKAVLDKIESMWMHAGKFDMFFILRGASLNNEIISQKNLPLESIVEALGHKWDKYIEKQSKLIMAEKFEYKKTTTLAPCKAFPKFVHYLLSKKLEYDNELLEDAFDKLCTALTDWLVQIVAPKAEKKKQERLIVVNTFYMFNKLKKSKTLKESTGFQQTMDTMQEFMKQHIDFLLRDLVSKQWKNATKFFTQITTWRTECGLSPDVVTFQPSHTDEKFQELVKDLEKNFQSNFSACQTVINNKIKETELRELILKRLSPYVDEMWKEWDDFAISCYNEGILPTPETVHNIMFHD
ncbi:hypothetical protein TVAG_302800 [Trichomonas vaginalis G3]|uniref:Uncharacterized protein n=1 Tax=Trichomonas vaginalis (strain ATCC PRA-98 / G3) TaxID=412133 RepID=A2FPL6_TRIV3|nr:Sec3/syntaxin-related family [Trichomonas vaginalis G3]EAX93140.1 hypothetical protein TVAG_302800 [Trichomonas vaginalis G3]KAI5502000.1 Sec3/syntaxin-related family [Trichomonas vaginalis G3]|eukprot:XP_001306070.1 hypothetical protein [Trichomonas vaginalis G3]